MPEISEKLTVPIEAEKFFDPAKSWGLVEYTHGKPVAMEPVEDLQRRQDSLPFLPRASMDDFKWEKPKEGEPIRYRATNEPIGKGANSIVFGGWDSRLGRRVAIKCLRDKIYTEPRVSAVAQYEASVMAHIDHPNILKVYDYTYIQATPNPAVSGSHAYEGWDSDKQEAVTIQGEHPIPALIMEYVDPETNVAQLLKSGKRFTPAELSAMVTQIADAVDYMASKGLYHCDLKPGNFFWDGSKVTITDFGIASTVFPEALGTPAFFSPEMVFKTSSDEPITVTSSSEVFSLASNVYYFLTNQYRFPGDPEDILFHTVANNGFTDPNKINILRYALKGTMVDIHKVVAVLDKAQQKNPAKRYQTAKQFAEALAVALTPTASPEALREGGAPIY